MIRKSKKIMASVLLALSLIATIPAINAFAVNDEENTQYYHFIKDECTQTTWNKYVYEKDGVYYLFGSDGKWKPNGLYGNNLYAGSNGVLQKNVWHQDVRGFWHYYGDNYINVIGYKIIDGKNYFFHKNGEEGLLKTGWDRRSKDDDPKNLQDKHWYYYGEDGSIKEGWLNYGGKWYYIYSDGLMAYDTKTPDGYYVNAKGVWVS